MVANLEYSIYPLDKPEQGLKTLFTTFSYDNDEEKKNTFDLFTQVIIPKYGQGSQNAQMIGQFIRPYLVDENGNIGTKEATSVGGTNIPDEEFSQMINDLKTLAGITFVVNSQNVNLNTQEEIENVFNALKNPEVENLNKPDDLVVDVDEILESSTNAVDNVIEEKKEEVEQTEETTEEQVQEQPIEENESETKEETPEQPVEDVVEEVQEETPKVEEEEEEKEEPKEVDLKDMSISDLEEYLNNANTEIEEKKKQVTDKEEEIKNILIEKIQKMKEESKKLDDKLEDLQKKISQKNI